MVRRIEVSGTTVMPASARPDAAGHRGVAAPARGLGRAADVLLGDEPPGPGALDEGEVHPELLGETPGDR